MRDRPLLLGRYLAPFDWASIDRAIAEHGAVIAEGLFDEDLVGGLGADVDAWSRDGRADAGPRSGSARYDAFLGHRTLRIHGLAGKLASAAGAIGHAEVVAWAQRTLAPVAASVLLNAGELIQIGPGEPAQLLHRDTASWPVVERHEDPVLVNAMVALSDFTPLTGATVVAPGSHRWPPRRRPAPTELVQATMRPGDALLFRGDVLHGGGANRSAHHRRGLSLSYCAGWLRPVENGTLNVPPAVAVGLPEVVQRLLGYAVHDATARGGGVVGLYEGGDPLVALGASAPGD